MFEEYQPLISAAVSRVYAVARRSALDYADQASAVLHNHIWLKREDQQSVFSYKLRGAYNLVATLDDEQKQNGVIAASAGNHAQGVALAAGKMAINATIVMPKTAPEIKVNAVRRLNAKVVLHGNTYDEARLFAEQLAAAEGRTFIPPYDHPLVIAGQATVAVELLQQCERQPDCIFVPVGGGGLIAGIALHVKANNPGIKIIGVEHDRSSQYVPGADNRERGSCWTMLIFLPMAPQCGRPGKKHSGFAGNLWTRSCRSALMRSVRQSRIYLRIPVPFLNLPVRWP